MHQGKSFESTASIVFLFQIILNTVESVPLVALRTVQFDLLCLSDFQRLQPNTPSSENASVSVLTVSQPVFVLLFDTN